MHLTLESPSIESWAGGHEATASVDVTNVVVLEAGYTSPYFVTEPETMEAVLESPLILVHDQRISSRWEFLPVLAKVVRAGRSLLVIAVEVEGDALATLVVNKISGVLPCVAVRLPASGEQKRAALEGLTLLLGGRSSAAGFPLELVTLHDLGSAARVVVTRDRTTITGSPAVA
jgi:chaperonin GroEL